MPRRTKPLSVGEINAARSREKPIILYDGGGPELLIRPGVLGSGDSAITSPAATNAQS